MYTWFSSTNIIKFKYNVDRIKLQKRFPEPEKKGRNSCGFFYLLCAKELKPIQDGLISDGMKKQKKFFDWKKETTQNGNFYRLLLAAGWINEIESEVTLCCTKGFIDQVQGKKIKIKNNFYSPWYLFWLCYCLCKKLVCGQVGL